MSETLEKCVSPVCYEKFEPSGLDIKPKRYCSDGCKLDVYALRRVAKSSWTVRAIPRSSTC